MVLALRSSVTDALTLMRQIVFKLGRKGGRGSGFRSGFVVTLLCHLCFLTTSLIFLFFFVSLELLMFLLTFDRGDKVLHFDF